MGLITITFTTGQSVGVLNSVSIHETKLLTIGYPVLAASISPELHTNIWSVEVVAEGGGPQEVTIARTLPTSSDELISLANFSIDLAFPLATGPLPLWEKRNDGYYLFNPTTGDVTFTFNSPSRILWVGGIATPTIPAGGSLGPFRPIPTLGAVSQNLEFQDGGVITLPISAAYGEPLLVHLPSDTPWPTSTGITATLSVRYPAINTKNIVTPQFPFEITSNVI